MPKLSKPNDAFLNIELENGKKYKIPLARSLKIKDLRKLMKVTKLDELEQFDMMIEFFGQYMGVETVEDMTQGQLMQLFTLWTKANSDTGELTLGES